MSAKAPVPPVMSVVYVKADCRHSKRMLEAIRAAGEQPIVIDIDRERYAIPELLKVSGGRRIVPVRVRGADIEVAPDGGTEF
jgi:glutaredoxin